MNKIPKTNVEVIFMQDNMWRFFKETGLTQAYLLYKLQSGKTEGGDIK
ncbi:MAG: hypothetical protein VB078_01140 [Clostridiaceae bacterium]|nr:hypothetical protein [Clostridiaceae bacterium]